MHLWFKFSFKMHFWEYLGEKTSKFLPQSLTFVCCKWNVYRSAPIPRILPYPEEFLVPRGILITVILSYGISFGPRKLFYWRWVKEGKRGGGEGVGWVKISANMVGWQRKTLKLNWVNCPKTVQKTKLGPENKWLKTSYLEFI